MKIGIIGSSGRMGCILTDLICKSENLALSGGISSKSTSMDMENVIKSSDVLIDFSTPDATVCSLELASAHGVPFVSGTTGFQEEKFAKIINFSRKIPLLHSFNFSLGIQLMAILLEKCAKALPEFDFSIVDKHHSGKKDAPSGTAIFLQREAKRTAQIVSLRVGNLCGDHICEFSGENEIVTLSHSALNRKVFALGALNCALWIVNKKPGLYTARDYLSEKIDM